MEENETIELTRMPATNCVCNKSRLSAKSRFCCFNKSAYQTESEMLFI